MCIAMNGDQLDPGSTPCQHQQPQLRRPAGQGRPHLPRLAAHRGRRGRHRAHHRRAQPARDGTVDEPHGKFTRTSPRTSCRCSIDNVDTDQIIPARFLKVTDKRGLGELLFNDWRYDADGSPKPDFVLNQPSAQGAQILLAGDNFGCGSSREHAPWALSAGASAR